MKDIAAILISRSRRSMWLPLPLLLAAVLLNAFSSSLIERRNAAPALQEPAAAPLVYWSETRSTPRPLRLHFLRVDLKSPEIEVAAFVGPDPDGNGPAESQLMAPKKLAEAGRALAAVNANAFAGLGTPHPLGPKWFEGRPVNIAGFALADGVPRSPDEHDRDAFWITNQGDAHIGAWPPGDRGIRHGVGDWGQRLLLDGRIPANLPKETLHPRTFIGLDEQRRYLLLIVADGRQPGKSEGLTLTECAQLLVDYGCFNGLNLDGGGSSIMLLDGPLGLRTMNSPSDPIIRPVPVMLGVREKE